MGTLDLELGHKSWSFLFYLFHHFPRLMLGIGPDAVFVCIGYVLRFMNRLGLNRTRMMMSHGWTYDKEEGFRCPMSIRERLVNACAKNETAEAAEIKWEEKTKEKWKYWSYAQRREYELCCEIGEFASLGISTKELKYDATLSCLGMTKVMRVWRTDEDLRTCKRFCILLPFTGDEGFYLRKDRSQELVAKGVCCLIPELPYYGSRRALEGQTEFFMRSISDYSTKALVSYADVVALTAHVKETLAMHNHESGSLVISGCSIGGYYCVPAAILAQFLTKNKKMRKSKRSVNLKIGVSVFCGWLSYDTWFQDEEKLPMAVLLTNLEMLANVGMSSLDKMTTNVREAYLGALKETNLKKKRFKMRETLALFLDDMGSWSQFEWRITKRAREEKTEKKLLNIDGILDAVSFMHARHDKFIPYSKEKMERELEQLNALSRTKPIVEVLECDHMVAISRKGPAIPLILDTFDRMVYE